MLGKEKIRNSYFVKRMFYMVKAVLYISFHLILTTIL